MVESRDIQEQPWWTRDLPSELCEVDLTSGPQYLQLLEHWVTGLVAVIKEKLEVTVGAPSEVMGLAPQQGKIRF